MNRELNVAIIQMPIYDTHSNLHYIKNAVDSLMRSYIKPELIVGVELGIGFDTQDSVPGRISEFFSLLAQKHGVYLIPGTMLETAPELAPGVCYNTCPVFAPDGSLLAAYRKMATFIPAESTQAGPSDGYCLFKIAEKDITVGVMICYDQYFPEIARTLALMGAELIVCPSLETMDFVDTPAVLPRARAMENELYYIWTSAAGNGHLGHSNIIDPEGGIVYQCGDSPTHVVKTLDFARVARKRACGKDQNLNCLRHFHIAYPFAGRLEEAPVYQTLPPVAADPQQYTQRLLEYGRPTINAKHSTDHSLEEQLQKLLDSFK